MRFAFKISLTFSTGNPRAESGPEPEQRDTALDALVIPADSDGPRELDANHRPDSYGFFDKGQAVGFSRGRRADNGV